MVKRVYVYNDGEIDRDDPEGEFVTYADYAALADQLAACQRERDELKAKSSEVVSGLVGLLKSIGVFGNLDFNHNGRPARDVLSEILAADTADQMHAYAIAYAQSRERQWQKEPTLPGWYWHWDGELYHMLFVFPRPGHSYLAVQDEPTGSGKRSFRMAAKIGGHWQGPLSVPSLPPPPTTEAQDER